MKVGTNCKLIWKLVQCPLCAFWSRSLCWVNLGRVCSLPKSSLTSLHLAILVTTASAIQTNFATRTPHQRRTSNWSSATARQRNNPFSSSGTIERTQCHNRYRVAPSDASSPHPDTIFTRLIDGSSICRPTDPWLPLRSPICPNIIPKWR